MALVRTKPDIEESAKETRASSLLRAMIAIVIVALATCAIWSFQKFGVPWLKDFNRVRSLSRDLKSIDAVARHNAAVELGEMGQRARGSVGALAEALRDEDDSVRIAAADALGKVGPRAQSAVSDLVRSLGDVVVQPRAVVTLRAIGHPAIPELLKALHDPNPLVHFGAARVIGDLRDKSAVPELVKLLRHENRHVRESAARAIGMTGDETATADVVLVEIVQDAELVTPEAVIAVGSRGLGGQAAIPTLLRILSQTDDRIMRNSARAALGHLGHWMRDYVPQLVELLDHENPEVRAAAAEVLGSTDSAGKVAIPKLLEAMTDPNRNVRLSAIEAGGRVGAQSIEETISALVRAMQSEDELLRYGGAVALYRLRLNWPTPAFDQALPMLRKMLDDPNPGNRDIAAAALKQIAPAARTPAQAE